jgi:hypothetical protein
MSPDRTELSRSNNRLERTRDFARRSAWSLAPRRFDREEDSGVSDKARWWRLEAMAESDRGHSWLVKFVIVVFVFPVLVLTLMQPWKLVTYGLTSVLRGDERWAQLIGWSAVIIGVLLALFGALWICRWIWPTATNKSHA